MDSWRTQIRRACCSIDGFASNLSDPDGVLDVEALLRRAEPRLRRYHHPVRRDTFVDYGLAFQQRLVPELEDKILIDSRSWIRRFRLRFEDGEIVSAGRVVIAVPASTYFAHVPPNLAHLPAEFLSHSSRHLRFRLLQRPQWSSCSAARFGVPPPRIAAEVGAEVQLVARQRF